MPDYQARLVRTQQRMAELGMDLLFLPPSADLHYLTGIPREEPNYGDTHYPGEWLTGGWIPCQGDPVLTLPRMLAEFHLGQVSGYTLHVLPDTGDPTALAARVLDALRVPPAAVIGIGDRAWAETLLHLQALRPRATFRQASTVLGPLRRIKDPEEQELLRRAGEITEAAYAAVLARLRHGMTNLDLITEVNHQLKRHGADTPSFVTAFYNMGPDYPFDFTNRVEVLQIPLEPPISISFDFGAVYQGYCYDYGRSVYFGEPDPEYRRCYDLVMAAQRAGIQALQAGNTCEQADAAAREVIAQAGYGEAFRHRLGHGIGMDVHEPPFLTAGDATVLEPGMCFTVEPSIFIPHRLGARVEDVVVVGREGGIPLTQGFRELHVVD